MSSQAAAIESGARPAWRISFRMLLAVVLGLFAICVVAGSYVYRHYSGDYRPLALSHVPETMRYRARVEASDAQRMPALAPLLNAIDPHERRLAALQHASPPGVLKELAFGVGPDPDDFVVVLGLRTTAEASAPAAQAWARVWCGALAEDQIRTRATPDGCRTDTGLVVAQTLEGAVVLASHERLLKGVLGTPDIGDRLGFSGPSVRGIAPEAGPLGQEATALAQRIAAKYP